MAADVAMESPSTGAEREKDREVKPKRSRASKPKVKTGCQTCKFVRLFLHDKLSALSYSSQIY